MRSDAEPFRSRNAAPVKYPRIVVEIEFEVESIFLTSHDDVINLPGVQILGVLQDPSAVSQRIVPDEARSEIGSFSFSLIDKDAQFTNAIRTRLLDEGYGLRGKRVRLYIGYATNIPGTITQTDTAFGAGTFGSGVFGGRNAASETDAHYEADFDEFGLFQTQIVTGVAIDAGVYRINCKDITREQRQDIFEPKVTNLAQPLTDSATTVEVYDTDDFQPIAHGTSYSDSPSATVGYIKIENEIIKYTAKTPSTFTGCTRGALNTKAVAHTFESTSDQDRRPKVEEYIYLEEPFVRLAYKVLTGKDPLTGLFVWPSHWHLGIDTSLVRVSDFTGIDKDIWDTTDDTAGVVSYFSGLKKVTGKRFLESEVYVLVGCYSPIYADGTIGLKRMNHVLSDSATVVTLNEDNCVSWSELRHEYDQMHNRIRIDWNWNGEEFTRSTLYIDEQSIAIHGEAPVKTYQFKGLHGSRHTDSLIRTRLNCIRDRYSQPPETISVSVLPSLNVLELGDVPRLEVLTIRDFADEGDHIDRSFEIQQGSYDFARGVVSFDLFGSTARADTTRITTDDTSLPDAFYTDRGTELSTACTIVVTGGVGVIQPGSYTLTGDPDVNDDNAIFYYDGELQLAAGATLNIVDNVQIRHNGFFEINGTIDGVGGGKAGVAAAGSWDSRTNGTPGFIGNSRGMDGVYWLFGFRAGAQVSTVGCLLTEGQYSAFPYLDLVVDGNDIIGIPADLRGTSGGPGGQVIKAFIGDTPTLEDSGGSGAASGAGLVLVGKGLGFGGAGIINLSGDDSSATSTTHVATYDLYPGAGGSGSPGGLLILIDGGSVSLPDISGHFTAACGVVPASGSHLPASTQPFNAALKGVWPSPGGGYMDPSYISGANLSNAAHRIQYLPAVQAPQADSSKPAAPTGLSALPGIAKVILVATVVLIPGDVIEYYYSATNDRTVASRIGRGDIDYLKHSLAPGLGGYYWIRVRRIQPGVDLFSDFYPSSPTGGVAGTASTVDTEDITANAATDTYTGSDASMQLAGVGNGLATVFVFTPVDDGYLHVHITMRCATSQGSIVAGITIAAATSQSGPGTTVGDSVPAPYDNTYITIECIAAVIAGVSCDVGIWGDNSVGGDIDLSNVIITTDLIKR